MTTELSEQKRIQLEERMSRRDHENESVLVSMGLSTEQSATLELSDSATEVTLDNKPQICRTCLGRGVYKPMFFEMDCPDCYGTGYRLDDPVSLIKWQKMCMDWSRKRILKLQNDLRIATTTEEERMAEDIENMYRHSKINKHD